MKGYGYVKCTLVQLTWHEFRGDDLAGKPVEQSQSDRHRRDISLFPQQQL